MGQAPDSSWGPRDLCTSSHPPSVYSGGSNTLSSSHHQPLACCAMHTDSPQADAHLAPSHSCISVTAQVPHPQTAHPCLPTHGQCHSLFAFYLLLCGIYDALPDLILFTTLPTGRITGSAIRILNTGSLRAELCVRQEVSSQKNYPTGLPVKNYKNRV